MKDTMTKPSRHPYHHVIIAKDQNSVTLCILNGNGEGGYDHWRVTENGHERVDGIRGNHFFQDYWQDYLPSKVIGNIYRVLDFYANICDNEEEKSRAEEVGEALGYSDSNFTADDIPF